MSRRDWGGGNSSYLLIHYFEENENILKRNKYLAVQKYNDLYYSFLVKEIAIECIRDKMYEYKASLKNAPNISCFSGKFDENLIRKYEDLIDKETKERNEIISELFILEYSKTIQKILYEISEGHFIPFDRELFEKSIIDVPDIIRAKWATYPTAQHTSSKFLNKFKNNLR